MKILVLYPFGSCEPYGKENLKKVARSDTEFDYECLKEVFPLKYNTFPYSTVKYTDAMPIDI